MKKFIHLANRPELSFGMRTENINGKRNYVTPSGELYPSITTVLGELSKAAIQKWRKRVGETEANKISGKASRRGTSLHSVCESYIKNEDGYLTGEMPHITELFQTIEPTLQKIDNIHGVELALYSNHFEIAGRTDLIAEFDGTLSAIDYKTSNKIKKKEWCENYFAQGSFYAIAYEELTRIPVPQVVIIIAVENEQPQLFVEKRDDWVHKIWEAKKLYDK
jgi:genome maintenance exonuclease 1|tara:strand:- start:181 stop:843 length:663 start_codon:yes stop_codon:yes gene_type:complete